MYIIRSDAGQPLREELAKSPEKIISSAFPEFAPKTDASTAQEPVNRQNTLVGDEAVAAHQSETSMLAASTSGGAQDAYFQGLALVKTLVKLMPTWLQNNRIVFDTLVLMWKSPARISRLQNEQELNLVQVSDISIHWDDLSFGVIFLLI